MVTFYYKCHAEVLEDYLDNLALHQAEIASKGEYELIEKAVNDCDKLLKRKE